VISENLQLRVGNVPIFIGCAFLKDLLVLNEVVDLVFAIDR
jgi:hypothetical protein